MTGDSRWFSSLTHAIGDEMITFGGNAQGRVLAKGTVRVNDKFILKDVALVNKLSYNLLSVSQLIDDNLEVSFKKHSCRILDSFGDQVCKITRVGRLFKGDFLFSSSSDLRCLVSSYSKEFFHWHRRLCHIGFNHLACISNLNLVRGLPNLKIENSMNFVCSPCRHGKMV